MNGAPSSLFVLPADPFESAGYSRYPECRMGRGGDDAGISLTEADLQRVARTRQQGIPCLLHIVTKRAYTPHALNIMFYNILKELYFFNKK
jgi:hypothetical protein